MITPLSRLTMIVTSTFSHYGLVVSHGERILQHPIYLISSPLINHHEINK